MKNLGTVSLEALKEIGIHQLSDLKERGWQQVLIDFSLENSKFVNLNMARALIGAIHNIDWRAVDEGELEEARKLIADLKK